jgi:hypothetical protein
MARSVAEIQAELALVDAAVSRILAGGVSEFDADGDQATMLDLAELRAHRADLQKELAKVQAGTRSRFVRAVGY